MRSGPEQEVGEPGSAALMNSSISAVSHPLGCAAVPEHAAQAAN